MPTKNKPKKSSADRMGLTKKVSKNGPRTGKAVDYGKPGARKLSKLDSVIVGIKAEYGASAGIHEGDEILDNFEHRIPFDIFGINVITRGGVVFNAMTEIKGPPSTFKTTIALGLVKQAQHMFGDKCVAVWLSTENGIDVHWARSIGVRIPYSPKEVQEFKDMGVEGSELKAILDEQRGGGRLFVITGDTIEKDLDNVIAMIATGEVSIYVLDSVGAVSAQSEMEGDHGDMQVAANARLISKVTRKLHAYGNRIANMGERTAFVVINQVRVKIGGFSPNPNVIPMDNPGGWGLKHGKVLSLETKVAGMDKDKTTGKVWAKHITVTVDKSKVCIPHRSARIAYITRPDNPLGLVVGPNSSVEAVELAREAGLLAYDGKERSWIIDGVVLMYQGKPATKDELALALQEDPSLLETVRKRVETYNMGLEIRSVRPATYMGQGSESTPDGGGASEEPEGMEES